MTTTFEESERAKVRRYELAQANRSGELTRSVLRGYLNGLDREKALLPGASDLLMKQFGSHPAPGGALQALGRHLAGPGAGLLNPERRTPDRPEHPLRAVLRGLPIKADARGEMYVRLAAELSDVPESDLAAAAWNRLQKTDCFDALALPDVPTVVAAPAPTPAPEREARPLVSPAKAGL